MQANITPMMHQFLLYLFIENKQMGRQQGVVVGINVRCFICDPQFRTRHICDTNRILNINSVYNIKVTYILYGCQIDKLAALHEVERDNRRSVYLVCTYV